MGVSNSLFSISEVQGDSEFISYLNELNSYDTPEINYLELESRKPTLNEVYESLKNAELEIISERTEIDEIELKNGKDITIHIFEIKSDFSEFPEDLTIKYESIEVIESISGIKTHHRILIKLAAELSKFCGSFYILNPYESYFIKTGKTYEQIWNEIKSS